MNKISPSFSPLVPGDQKFIEGIRGIYRSAKWINGAKKLKEESADILHEDERRLPPTITYIILAIICNFDVKILDRLLQSPKDERRLIYSELLKGKPIGEYYGKFTPANSWKEIQDIDRELAEIPAEERTGIIVSERYLQLATRRDGWVNESKNVFGNMHILYCSCQPIDTLSTIEKTKLFYTMRNDNYYLAIVKYHRDILEIFNGHHPTEFVKCSTYLRRDDVLYYLRTNTMFHQYYADHEKVFWTIYSPLLAPPMMLEGIRMIGILTVERENERAAKRARKV